MSSVEDHNILVVGSRTRKGPQKKKAAGATDPFGEVCHAVGTALGKRGYGLVIGSIAERTADYHVLVGYAEADGPRVLLIRGDVEDHESKLKELVGTATEVHLEPVPQEAWRMRQLRRAHGVLFVGGRTGTATAFQECQLRVRPFTAFPQVAGEGTKIFSQLEAMVGESADSQLLQMVESSQRDPAAAVELLSTLISRPLVPSLQPRALEPHVLKALSNARGRDGITADAALRAALGVLRGGSAFQKLRDIVEREGLEPPEIGAEAAEMEGVLAPPFAHSLHIARSAVPGRSIIWGRALVTAALFDPQIESAQWLRPALESVRKHWADFLESNEASHWPRWLEALDEYQERFERPSPGDGIRQTLRIDKAENAEVLAAAALAGYSGDDVPLIVLPEDDRLQIGPEVDALASVIAARDVEPPLSVALFGDWGAGKSFFMRQIRSRIAALAEEADAVEEKRETGSLEPGTPEPAFWPNIAQIEFNAWQYMDTKLWASLVSHLFKGLVRHIRETDSIEGPEDEILRELSLVSGEAARLQEELKGIEDRIGEAEKSADKLADQRRQKVEEVAQISLAAAFGRELANIVVKNKHVRQILAEAGVIDLASEGEQLARQLRELDRVAQRHQVRLAIVLGKRARRGLVAWTLAFLVGAFVLLAALSRLAPPPDWAELLRSAGQAVAVLSGILGPAALWLGRVGQAFSALDRALDSADKKAQAERAGSVSEERKLRSEIEELAEKEKALRKELAQNQRDMEAIEAEREDLLSGKRLLDFVEERAGSEEYAKHLGLISVIREDFERLSKELGDMSDRCRDAWKKGPAKTTRNPGAQVPQDATGALRKINRIVLYIDDLDRCPPELVVLVMQAVHLLLAFPLFVVVVAVDSRWLLRSLAKVYPDFLKLEGADDPAGRRATTPQHYLEKIFQVTYSLDPIDATGYATLLRDLLDKPMDEEPPELEGIRVLAAREDGADAGLSEDERRVRRPQLVPRQDVLPIDMNPKSLAIEDQEWAFMEMLDPFFETPRTVKRFVNTYRILKVTHGSALADGDSQRIVLTFLAALVGFPRATAQLMGRLAETSASNWSEFLKDRHGADGMAELCDILATIEADWSIEELCRWWPSVARFTPRLILFDSTAGDVEDKADDLGNSSAEAGDRAATPTE